VLWQYVRTLQQADKAQRIVIYTGDQESGAEILQRAQDRFNLPPIAGAAPVEFVRLQYRHLITAERWPRFTMFGQSLGSVVLAFEALWKCPPSLFIDTTGFAFTYPLARYLFGVDVHCYTHYPTISSDMLALVFERRESYNNVGAVARSPLKARVKWIYYKLFAFCYSRAGRAAGSVFVNSTWTRRHIDDLWNMPERTRIVFPPCDTASLRSLPLGQITRLSELSSPRSSSSKSSPVREDIIISIGQFRPEKDHALQLRAFQQFRRQLLEIEKACASKAQDRLASRFKLVLIGGARDAGDRQRVEELKKLAVELDIAEFVQFELNVPFSELKQWLARATVGLHTMWNEHFGIGVVEFMAAGSVAHRHQRSAVFRSRADSSLLSPSSPV
jgi:alpha-1,2-mannosyltransferase